MLATLPHVLLPALHPLLLGIRWMDPNWLLDQFGGWFLAVCLLMVFIECGLFFPFLPGDTLLFAVGLFVTTRDGIVPGPHALDLPVGMLLLAAAAIAGNLVGYEIGRFIGPPLYERNGRILKRAYFDKTDEFFDRHGNKALVIGRFVPFVRTYITVVAGVTRMPRPRFLAWSAVGAVAWVLIVTLLGYFLGAAFPGLGKNIDKAILLILLLSVIPVAWEWWRHRRQSRAEG